jgi:hypothetical protein
MQDSDTPTSTRSFQLAYVITLWLPLQNLLQLLHNLIDIFKRIVMSEADSHNAILIRFRLPRVIFVEDKGRSGRACIQRKTRQNLRRIEMTVFDADLESQSNVNGLDYRRCGNTPRPTFLPSSNTLTISLLKSLFL